MILAYAQQLIRTRRLGLPSSRGSLRVIATAISTLVCLLGAVAIPAAVQVQPATAALPPTTSIATTTTTITNSTTTTTAPPAKTVPSYWLVASDGGIFAFGGLASYGSMGGQHLDKPIVGMAGTANSAGYWLVASDGGIFTFGNASFHNSMGGQHLNKPIVAMAVTPDGNGYWLVASDGGIFSFGTASFYGSTGALVLNKPMVSMVPTKTGRGYWLVASDGGIFGFGDASFHGSTGSQTLNKPVVSMAASAGGGGYWLVASDGGIFAFGDAPYYGSAGGETISRPIVTIQATPSSSGYWFSDTGGLVFNYGAAGYFGSAPAHLNAPVVGMAGGMGSGAYGANPSYPSGAYGYDISNYQCGNFPPPPHQIGVVEVNGASFGYANHCLASEAAWAGAGLNLYTFLTYGTATSGPAICNGANSASCNSGFGAAQYAFTQAQSAGINTSVTWWLDVESDPSWSSNTSANAAFVQGAVNGMKAEGVNNVGIYTSPLSWSGIVGSYQPQLPLWVAWYTGNPQQNCSTAYAYASSHGNSLPSGGVWLTQYTDNANGYDGDYAC